MKEKNTSAIDKLITSISYMIDAKCKNLYYDKTFLSVVVAVADKGKYLILKDGQNYPVTNATNAEFKVGDNVWVKIPSGLLENMFICGIKRK